ncbi:MAG: hypothetical protein HZB26_14230 [Candidatus Hydrogenedentes bacterium]|nr:hypothetical protein [Candidatus Hydrogenedentota bacterium]
MEKSVTETQPKPSLWNWTSGVPALFLTKKACVGGEYRKPTKTFASSRALNDPQIA